MQPAILRSPGEKLGNVIEVEAKDKGNCVGKFGRIRILKNIAEPLLKGLCVSLPNSIEESYIVLIYEKLSNFCYVCGRLGHVSRDCEDSFVDLTSLAFGDWIRAHSPPVNHRPGNMWSRNSESSVPSGQGEATESPSNSDRANLTSSLELNLLNLNTSAHQIIRHEGSDMVSGQLDVFPDHYDLLGKSGLFVPELLLDGEDQVNKVVLEAKSMELISLRVMAKGKEVVMVERNIPKKYNKQWKKLAHGELLYHKDQDKEVYIANDGKRSRELTNNLW